MFVLLSFFLDFQTLFTFAKGICDKYESHSKSHSFIYKVLREKLAIVGCEPVMRNATVDREPRDNSLIVSLSVVASLSLFLILLIVTTVKTKNWKCLRKTLHYGFSYKTPMEPSFTLHKGTTIWRAKRLF